MKKIIVPVDFSKNSEFAMEVAAEIAKKQKAELLLLHMLDISDQMISITESTQRREFMFFIQMATKQFEEFVDKEYLKGIKVTPIIKHHKIFEEINNVATEVKADLIVMGSRGATGVKGFLVGSNTEKVVRTSEIPVLIIKNKVKEFTPKTLIFASDFDLENINAFEKVKTIANKLDAKIKLVYINTPNVKFKNSNEINKQMQTFLLEAKLPSIANEFLVYNDYSVEDGILNAAKFLNADLIAIPTHGRKGVNKILIGSISEDIANHASLPVLTIKIE
ncbi:MAG: universal stress protein [Bacteroidetes bacterium HGW-Bacteroidetes-2]|jgi:nucleotide-binding universal stress UspA family protein|nr:MAG: universal stress protein [Bacteroidetes bacterium HGW-Bacteroidetes-2]